MLIDGEYGNNHCTEECPPPHPPKHQICSVFNFTSRCATYYGKKRLLYAARFCRPKDTTPNTLKYGEFKANTNCSTWNYNM
jgi:hypothetical protein